jgi:ribosomal protein S18 acetylase RimI-like enzyme
MLRRGVRGAKMAACRSSTSTERDVAWVVLPILAALLLLSVGQMGVVVTAIQLKYRPARKSDLNGIAKLLTATFENVPEWNVIQWKMAEDGYKKQLKTRMEKLVKQGAKHALIVVANEDAGGEIAGFMELGTMPSPLPVLSTTTISTWQGIEIESKIRPEKPYLANVAIGRDYRRNKMGSKLVRLAMKISETWCVAEEGDAALYLAVDKDNVAAISMYDKLKFVRIIDETEKISNEALRKLQRKPRLYFQKVLGQVKSDSTS